ncbi:MAG: hypothetical protein GY721_13675 [Deltaproteobacteria bacterium]|nr:hypothetical protein [Deltaproteobacteria bacterium]
MSREEAEGEGIGWLGIAIRMKMPFLVMGVPEVCHGPGVLQAGEGSTGGQKGAMGQ